MVMSTEEAIRIIGNVRRGILVDPRLFNEAMRKAIEALTDKITANHSW